MKSNAWKSGAVLYAEALELEQRDHKQYAEALRKSGDLDNYGLLNMQLNKKMLRSGKFAISSVSGMLPQGQYFNYKESRDHDHPELSIDLSNEYTRKQIPIYLSQNRRPRIIPSDLMTDHGVVQNPRKLYDLKLGIDQVANSLLISHVMFTADGLEVHSPSNTYLCVPKSILDMNDSIILMLGSYVRSLLNEPLLQSKITMIYAAAQRIASMFKPRDIYVKYLGIAAILHGNVQSFPVFDVYNHDHGMRQITHIQKEVMSLIQQQRNDEAQEFRYEEDRWVSDGNVFSKKDVIVRIYTNEVEENSLWLKTTTICSVSSLQNALEHVSMGLSRSIISRNPDHIIMAIHIDDQFFHSGEPLVVYDKDASKSVRAISLHMEKNNSIEI